MPLKCMYVYYILEKFIESVVSPTPRHYTGALGPTQTTGRAPPAGLTNTSSICRYSSLSAVTSSLNYPMLLARPRPTLNTLPQLQPQPRLRR